MIITVNKALNAVNGLQALNNAGKLSMFLSMVIAHNARELETIQLAYNANRNALLNQYGDWGEETGSVRIPAESQSAFNQAMENLMAEEVEINEKQLKLSQFPTVEEGYAVEPLALVALDWMLVDDVS